MQEGSRLGPYEILRPLGEGGMGAVYLARDTRLGREVAIKVLPEAFAADPERLARFEQEARAAAALNHPHIATVHDVGVDEAGEAGAATHYIVQEYLQGSTLQEALGERKWPLSKTLAYATEIAEALAAAHAAGIVHRDLKPANVFVTQQGHAKVLDFGLAKLTEPVTADATSGTALTALDASPTVLGTSAGQIMGTAGYMAPEQVEGGSVDGRTDVFAFGCLLYEMCAGRRPFAGRSVLQTLDRIVHEEPEPLPPGAGCPAPLRWIVAKCLAKDPDLRYQSAADLVVDLRRLAADVNAGRGEADAAPADRAPAATGGGLRPLPTFAIVASVAVLAALLGAWSGADDPPPTPLRRFETRLPEGIQITAVGRPAVAISPDGSRVAVTACGSDFDCDDEQIWIRELHEPALRPIPGTEGGGRAPVFSPDGREIAFWREDELLRIGIAGGVPVRIASANNPWGLYWSDDDAIVYGQGSDGIWSVPASGGEPEQIYEPRGGESVHGPQLLAGGWLLMSVALPGESWDEGRIVVHHLPSDRRVELVREARDARLLASGHLVYARHNTLLGQRFDPAGPAVVGVPVPLLSDVLAARNLTGTAHLSVADEGTLAYLSGEQSIATGEHALSWLDAGGELEPTALEQLRTRDFRLSPEGERIVAIADPDGHVMVYDLRTGVGTRLATSGAPFYNAIYGPDGRWIWYSQTAGRDIHVHRVPADGSGLPEPVLEAPGMWAPEDAARDGSFAILRRETVDRNDPDLVRLWLADGRLDPLVDTPARESYARLSPTDPRWLAYVSRDGVQGRVFVHDLESGARHAVSAVDHSPRGPEWADDGRRLFYVDQQNAAYDRLFEVTIATEPNFRAGRPELVAELVFSTDNDGRFEVAGDRFLVLSHPRLQAIREVEEGTERLVFVTGWLDSLRRLIDAR